MNKIISLTIGLLLVSIISGCVEKEIFLNTNFRNSTNKTIQVYIYPTSSSFPETNWYTLAPSEMIKVLDTSTRGSSPSNKLPNSLFPSFLSTDSSVVVFSDTLRVTHYTGRYSNDQDTIRENVIAFDDSRNMFNEENFTVEKTGENTFEATYSFTEDDVEYAISINE